MSTALTTELTQMLQLTTPILSAPMAGVAGGALASAVSRAGGLGLIGGGYGDREWLVRELDIAGDAGVGVGFITWALARDPALLILALERRPRAIFLSFGDLRPHAATIARAGIPLIAQVQTLADARMAIAEGAQIIVAQGTEAGGHGGVRATMALVPAIVDAVGDVPVVAAGGIADGRGLAASLMLGAAGVLCGTAFYVALESLAHPNVKAAAVEHREITPFAVRCSTWCAGWNGRTSGRSVRSQITFIASGRGTPRSSKPHYPNSSGRIVWLSNQEMLQRPP
jgi:nitronate monooxygenase